MAPFTNIGLTLIPAWISNYIHYKAWGEITYPFLNFNGVHGLTLIPAWISNYIHYKVWDEITYPFLNFNGATVEV